MKKITIKFNEQKYDLEFTRKTIAQMERSGFEINEIGSKPVTMIPQLFRGAFLAHHPRLKPETIDIIYDGLDKKVELIGNLIEMFKETIETLFDDKPEEEGNASWGANW